MIIYPEEILELKKFVEPWEIGAGIFKKDTPPEVLEANKKIMEWFHKETDGIQ